MIKIKRGNAVIFPRVFLGGRKALALFREDMHKKRSALLLPVGIEQRGKLAHIMPVYGAHILESHLFEHGGMIQRASGPAVIPHRALP